MIPSTMKAVVLTQPTPAEQVALTDCPVPRVRPGWVLVKVRAFGMNHSEQILRLGEIQADYIQKPIIPGIECVGQIADPSDSPFREGQRVAALMGGMGRSFNGSYAQYALLPASHVFAVETALSWAEMAAVPETYFTAWGSLFECLQLCKDDTLLVRGDTCALGYAAIRLAKALGCRVIATTHRENKLPSWRRPTKPFWTPGNWPVPFPASPRPWNWWGQGPSGTPCTVWRRAASSATPVSSAAYMPCKASIPSRRFPTASTSPAFTATGQPRRIAAGRLDRAPLLSSNPS